jgi:hypothetical protein
MNHTQHKGAEDRIAGKRSAAGPVAIELAAGAAVGALTGVIAGPTGAAIGAVIGGVIGVAAGVAVARGKRDQRIHDAQLDREIGVFGGNLGEASPNQPPPKLGLYHAASVGVTSSGAEPSDGIIQNVDAAE